MTKGFKNERALKITSVSEKHKSYCIQSCTKNFKEPFKQNYGNHELETFHEKFFNYACEFFPNIKTLSEKQKQENKNALILVTEKSEFLDFCKNSQGLYYKCCLWALNFGSCKVGNSPKKGIFEDHHIVCKFLKKYESDNMISALIDAPFNLVRLSYPIHYFLHVVHALEYGYLEDYHFLDIVDHQLAKTQNSKKIFGKKVSKQAVKMSLQQEIKKIPHITEKLLELKRWQAKASYQGGKISGYNWALSVLDPEVGYYLKREMRWENKKLNINKTFEPNQFKILRELVIALNKLMPTEQLPLGWQNNQQYLEGESTRLKYYLLGMGKSKLIKQTGREKFYSYKSYKKNWYCDQAETNQHRLNRLRDVVKTQTTNSENSKEIIKPTAQEFLNTSSVNKQGDGIDDVLNSTYIWSNKWFYLHQDVNLREKTKELQTNPKKFSHLKELVKYLMDLLPTIQLKKYPKYKKYMEHARIRKDFIQSFNNHILKKKKPGTNQLKNGHAYGWTCYKKL